MSIAIATYSVRVRALRGTDDLFLKFQKGAAGATVHKAVADLLQEVAGTFQDDGLEQHMLIVESVNTDSTDVWGLVRRGEYGSEFPIYSSKSKTQTHTQTTDEAGMRPFYFRLHLPPGSQMGLMLIQRNGVYGAYTELRKCIEDGFKKKYPEYRLHFTRAVHPKIISDILSAPVQAYEIDVYEVPSDLTDFIKAKGPVKNVGWITVKAEAQKGKWLWSASDAPSWYKKVLAGKASIAEVMPDNVREVSVTVDDNGTERTFDVSRAAEDLFPYTSIDGKVKSLKGNPVFESIDAICIEMRDELMKGYEALG